MAGRLYSYGSVTPILYSHRRGRGNGWQQAAGVSSADNRVGSGGPVELALKGISNFQVYPVSSSSFGEEVLDYHPRPGLKSRSLCSAAGHWFGLKLRSLCSVAGHQLGQKSKSRCSVTGGIELEWKPQWHSCSS